MHNVDDLLTNVNMALSTKKTNSSLHLEGGCDLLLGTSESHQFSADVEFSRPLLSAASAVFVSTVLDHVVRHRYAAIIGSRCVPRAVCKLATRTEHNLLYRTRRNVSSRRPAIVAEHNFPCPQLMSAEGHVWPWLLGDRPPC